jgi:hypothetical protein
MNDSRVMSESQKLGEMGNGKRAMIVLAAVLVGSALIGVLVSGFHGSHIRRDAAAMAAPVGETVGPRVSSSTVSPPMAH